MTHRCVVAACFALLVAGCGEPAGTATTCSGVALEAPVLVLGSDFQASSLGRIETDGCLTEVPDLALGADPALARGRGGPFVVVRDQGLVHAIDPDALRITRTYAPFTDAEAEAPFPLASCPRQTKGINPHDADLDAAGRLWVTRYEKPSLGRVAADGSFAGAVDLAPLADADGVPEAEAIRVVGDRVYVTLQRLDRCDGYAITGGGVVAALDADTGAPMAEFVLPGENPFGRMVPAPWDPTGGTVAIALPGDPYAIDGGAAAAIVDLPGGEARGFGDEAALGGSITEVALAAPDEAYVIVADPDPTRSATHVARIDPTTGALGMTMLDSRDETGGGGFCHAGLAVVGAHLLVGANGPCKAAIHVLERATGREVGVVRPSRLPPISLLGL